jgi:hypothetical protein
MVAMATTMTSTMTTTWTTVRRHHCLPRCSLDEKKKHASPSSLVCILTRYTNHSFWDHRCVLGGSLVLTGVTQTAWSLAGTPMVNFGNVWTDVR